MTWDKAMRIRAGRIKAGMGAAAMLLAMTAGAQPGWGQPAERLFPTPEAAVSALVAAVEQRDRAMTEAILGPAFAGLVAAQGPEARADDRELFLAAAKQAVVLRPDGPDRLILEVGASAWPLPAPLVKEEGGWRFDGAAGAEAVQDRVIGRNELEAIGVLKAYSEAQVAYAAEDRDGDQVLEYAQRLGSTPGTHDGLYWPVAGAEEPSPFGPFLAEAGVRPESRAPATPYYGYMFRILTRQGPNVPGGAYDYVINGNMIAGFAMVAWPAAYGETGVMTFVVNQAGTVLERDLGPETSRIASQMATYDPDADWKPAED
jgi:hypothetical protein